MNPYDRTDKIDSFLADTMDSVEKKEFERLLSSTSNTLEENNLHNEIEMQKKIILAIQEEGMKEVLRTEEKRMQKRHRINRFIDRFILSSAIIAAAACLAAYFILSPTIQMMTAYGVSECTEYSETTANFIVRGNEENMDLLADAVEAMSVNDWNKAELSLNKIIDNTDKAEDEQLLQIRDEAEWLQAILSMQRGRYFSAKKRLNKIASSNSIYAEQAIVTLQKLQK